MVGCLISILKERSCQQSKLITAFYLYQPPWLRMTRYGSMMCVRIHLPTCSTKGVLASAFGVACSNTLLSTFSLRLPSDRVLPVFLIFFITAKWLWKLGAALVHLSLSDLMVSGWPREGRLISCNPWPRARLHLRQLVCFSWLRKMQPDQFRQPFSRVHGFHQNTPTNKRVFTLELCQFSFFLLSWGLIAPGLPGEGS